MTEQYAILLLVTFISLITCSYAVIFHIELQLEWQLEMEADVWNRFVRL
jgi:hypothetical protein